MSSDGVEQEEVPRTDICEDCDQEILWELVSVEGKHDLIHQARKADEGFMPITGGEATVRFSCRCGSAEVEFGPGSASAWDIPDGWLWEDDFNLDGGPAGTGTETENGGGSA